MERQLGPRLCWEKAGVGWAPPLLPLVVLLLLQVCLTRFSCGEEGGGKCWGTRKEEDKRRSGLPTFFERSGASHLPSPSLSFTLTGLS